MSFAADMIDAGRLVRFFSRQDFKKLPPEFVLVPSLDAPVLVFERPPIFIDFDDSVCLALPLLREKREQYPRWLYVYIDGDDEALNANQRADRKRAAALLRRIWCQVVDQAECYTWPDATHYGVPAYYEFAPDA